MQSPSQVVIGLFERSKDCGSLVVCLKLLLPSTDMVCLHRHCKHSSAALDKFIVR